VRPRTTLDERGRSAYLLYFDWLGGTILRMVDEEILFYDPEGQKEIYQRHLPHWNQVGRIYFVTFRLADSIPAERAEELRRERQTWCKTHFEPYSSCEWEEYHRLFSVRVEQWLDQCSGACLLADPSCAQIVVDAMSTFDGQRYELDEWVVTPNHVHALVAVKKGFALEGILQGWKSFTAHAINRRLSRNGQLWQRESFDHIVRGPAHLERFRHYIRENPTKAGRFASLCRLRSS